jgi:hypothetical protein
MPGLGSLGGMLRAPLVFICVVVPSAVSIQGCALLCLCFGIGASNGHHGHAVYSSMELYLWPQGGCV